MKHQQPGLSALEVIIGIMISAILMTASLTIYNQISKGAATVQRITQADTQIMILHNRLVADLQGLVPLWFTKQHYEELKKAEQAKDAKNIEPGNNSNQKQNNFLFAQSNNNQFENLTFVTTNALQIYGDQPIRTVRVVYKLEPEKTALGNFFKLLRKEEHTVSGDFNLEQLKSGKFNQIAHKITKCTIEYGFIETDNKKAQETKDNEKPFEFKFVSKWGGATESNTEENKTPTLPDILKLTISLQNNQNQDAKTYELFCTIPTSHATALKSFAQKRQEDKKQPSNAPGQASTSSIQQNSQTTPTNQTASSPALPTGALAS